MSEVDTQTVPRLTYEGVVASLHKAVQTMGEDFIYTPPEGVVIGCRYFDKDGNPSCLVGHVLADAGLEPMPLDASTNKAGFTDLATGLLFWDHIAPGSGTRVLFFTMEDYTGPETQMLYDSRIYNLLSMVQRYQDRRCPWGKAVKWALANEGGHGMDVNPSGKEVWR